jgi:hypothetical protein
VPAAPDDPNAGVAGEEASAWMTAPTPRRPSTPVAESKAKVAYPPFTVAVLPDTQVYAEYHPEIFYAQTRWIADHHKEQGIKLVLHEGDIVNNDDVTEWSRARKAMSALDGVVPYALARGNHDLKGGYSRIGGLMDSFFRASDFLQYPWFRETYEVGHMDDSFLLVDLNGQKWVVLALEYGPRDTVLAWASRILRRFAALPAMIVTHAYLYDDRHRYDHRNHPEQLYGPHDLALEGGVNDGEEMWEKLVSRHDNVLFVLSGHVVEGGVGRLTSVRRSGAPCHQILANYQIEEKGGNGFLRLMRFEPDQDRVVVRTYSPYLNRYKTDPANDFVLDLAD